MPSFGVLAASDDASLDAPEIWICDIVLTLSTPLAVWGAIDGSGETLYLSWTTLVLSGLSRLITAIVTAYVGGLEREAPVQEAALRF
jgi:hypothetical protein